ncbi:protein sprT (plasmid) [Paenibacillus thiaminolyticus]|uniref:protein sprT n=1 Tax=Paenibacillus thiaminolyticus TaxID=49283 RepID=UPI002330023F|nr:protein sprT [Paenibacillus thiaminolyticus]WCF11556.1 protein sprT [Paenibacillus thiaminolyticus]
MVNVLPGEHYTYDSGQNKLIIFITHKGKYEGEDVYFFDTITAVHGDIFVKDYEVNFFKDKNFRLSTVEEIEEIRSLNPYSETWIQEKIEEWIPLYWDIDERPNIVFDPDEIMTVVYEGAYESSTRTLLFRSELLSVNSVEAVRQIILHELCHWYLHVTGQEWRDKDVRFAEEIIRLGIEDRVSFHRKEAREAYEQAKKQIK